MGRSGEQKALKGESEILPPESRGKEDGFSAAQTPGLITSLPLASDCRVTKDAIGPRGKGGKPQSQAVTELVSQVKDLTAFLSLKTLAAKLLYSWPTVSRTQA